jgi:hypothetical protein
MSTVWDTVKNSRAVRLSKAAVGMTWGYVTERVWPVYSTGMIFGTLMLIASMHEKQTIADHFFGHHKSKIGAEEIEAATQLMDDEIQLAVKRDVYRMDAAKFSAEAARLAA